MFCLAHLILLWVFFFFSRNTFYIDMSPSVWVHFSLCHCFFYLSSFVFVSQGIGEISDFIFSIKGE